MFTNHYDDEEFHLLDEYTEEFEEITGEKLSHMWPQGEDKSNPEGWDLLKVVVIIGCISEKHRFNKDLHLSDPSLNKRVMF